MARTLGGVRGNRRLNTAERTSWSSAEGASDQSPRADYQERTVAQRRRADGQSHTMWNVDPPSGPALAQ
jgi:hypothetical protein